MKTVDNKSMHGYIVGDIGKRIVCGELTAGSALQEAELCASLGASRTALREAFRVLIAKGLIKARQRAGTRVTPKECWNFLDADILAWRLETQDSERVMAEILQLRQVIEPVAAALAAFHATAEDLRKMRAAYAQMEAVGDHGTQIVDPDVRFHLAIVAASGNRLFSSLGHVIEAALTLNFKVGANTPRGLLHSLPLHKKVLEAVSSRDPAAARLAMRKLIEDSADEVALIRQAKTPRSTETKKTKVDTRVRRAG